MNFNNIIYISTPKGELENIKIDNKIAWERAHIYGVSWSGGTSPTMTRTDDASGFSTPVIGKGTTKGSSPFDNCYPWSKIRVVTDNGNVLVEIPKFWYKWTKSGSTMKLQISDKKVPNFNVSPMHQDRGDGVGERDVAYIGKYKCVYDYKSKANFAPMSNITIGTARTKIAALGSGYYQQDYASFWTLRLLFLVEWATWNSQSVLKNTTDFDSLSSILTGETSSMSYHTGISASGRSVQYRYVEDPWENLLEYVDGLYFSGTNVYCINNPSKFATGSNGTKIGTRSTGYGYIKSWSMPTTSGFEWALIPETVVNAESYTHDSYYYDSAGTIAYIGGSRTAWNVHGAFFIYTDFTASSTSASIGVRLMKLP